MDIIIPNANLSRANQAAFSGNLDCPFCNPEGKLPRKWKFVDKPSPFRIIYRCLNCMRKVMYDFSCNEEYVRLYKIDSEKARLGKGNLTR